MSTKTTIGLAVVLALGAATAAVAMTNYEVQRLPCGVRPTERSRCGLRPKPGGRLRHQ